MSFQQKMFGNTTVLKLGANKAFELYVVQVQLHFFLLNNMQEGNEA